MRTRTYRRGDTVTVGSEIERRRPARGASIESDVAVPGLQAAISGLLSGVAVLALALGFGWDSPLRIAAAVAIAVTILTWIGLLSAHRRLLWELEEIRNRDIDGDGEIGRPEPPQPEPITRVEVIDEGGHRIRWFDVPLEDRDLERLARALLVERRALARRHLDDIIAEDQYTDVLDALIEGDAVRLKGKSRQAGVELTAVGRAFLRQYLN